MECLPCPIHSELHFTIVGNALNSELNHLTEGQKNKNKKESKVPVGTFINTRISFLMEPWNRCERIIWYKSNWVIQQRCLDVETNHPNHNQSDYKQQQWQDYVKQLSHSRATGGKSCLTRSCSKRDRQVGCAWQALDDHRAGLVWASPSHQAKSLLHPYNTQKQT